MSLYEYEMSKEIAWKNYPFYALVMAAMRQADSSNTEKLKAAFPGVYEELEERYNGPGGLLLSERFPRGAQIIYAPPHAGDDMAHKDCEEGFVTSARWDSEGRPIVFCRFWSKNDPTRLRTTTCSEGAPADRVFPKTTRSQDMIDKCLREIEAEGQ